MDKYCEFKDIKSRVAGRKKFVEFKLVIPGEISVKDGYCMVKQLEDDINSGIIGCETMIKMEPCKKDCIFYENGEKCPYVS